MHLYVTTLIEYSTTLFCNTPSCWRLAKIDLWLIQPPTIRVPHDYIPKIIDYYSSVTFKIWNLTMISMIITN